MSKKLASLLIKIGANGTEAFKAFGEVSKQAEQLSKKMDKLGSKLTRNLTVPLTALGGLSIKLANDQQQAEARLLTALQGREAVQQRLIQQASEIQSRSTLGDEAIIAQQAYLASLGLTEQQIRDTIDAAVELSYATGAELEGTVRNLAKTYGGLTGELGESIPALKELTAEQLRNGEAIAYVKENYQGFAETAATTGAGALVQLKNKVGDLAEKLGAALLPLLDKVVAIIDDVVEWLNALDPATVELIATVGALAAAVGPLVSVASKVISVGTTLAVTVIPKIGSALTWLATNPIAMVTTALAGLIVAFTRYENAAEKYAAKSNANPFNSIEAGIGELEDARKKYGDAANLTDEGISAKIAELRDVYVNSALRDRATNASNELRHLAAKEMRVIDAEIQTLESILEARRLQRDLMSRVNLSSTNLSMDGGATLDSGVHGGIEGIDTRNPFGTVKTLKELATLQGGGWQYEQWLEDKKASLIRKGEELASLAQSVGGIVRDAFVGMGETLGEGLGKLMAGEKFNAINAILGVLADAIKNLGAALLAYATTELAVEEALKSMDWPVAVAAGIAAIAAGTALKIVADKPIKLAKGGLAYGPTLAVVGDNPGASYDPEVVAPLSKLRNMIGGPRLELVGDVEFVMRGSSLRALLSRENIRLSYEK